MNNSILLRYEIRRLILNKKYFYLLLVTAVWTYDILMRLIINGTDGTAPFSQWSYTSFISILNPLLLSILVLLCISLFSEKEIAVRRIIFSTPISEAKYYALKATAILCVMFVTSAVPIVMSLIYYAYLFRFYGYLDFLMPVTLFLLPGFIFVLGLSMVLGKQSVKFLYILLPTVFFSGMFNLGLSPYLDVCGNNLLVEYLVRLTLEQKGGMLPYILPQAFIYSRVVFVILGTILFLVACKKSGVK